MKVFFKARVIAAAIGIVIGGGAHALRNTVPAADPQTESGPPATTTADPSAPAQQPSRMTQQERARHQKMKQLPPAVQATTESQPQGESAPLPERVRSRVLAEAARHTGSRTDAITIVESTAVTWPDGSLGCPERDATYPQLPLAGYRVVVSVNGKTYDYRVASPPGAASPANATNPTSLAVRLCDSTNVLDRLPGGDARAATQK